MHDAVDSLRLSRARVCISIHYFPDENIQPFIRFRKADPRLTNPNQRFFSDYEI